MQQVEMKLGGSLLDMMNEKPFVADAFRAGTAWATQKRRIYQAAYAAQKSNATPSVNNIAVSSRPAGVAGYVKTNRLSDQPSVEPGAWGM